MPSTQKTRRLPRTWDDGHRHGRAARRGAGHALTVYNRACGALREEFAAAMKEKAAADKVPVRIANSPREAAAGAP